MYNQYTSRLMAVCSDVIHAIYADPEDHPLCNEHKYVVKYMDGEILGADSFRTIYKESMSKQREYMSRIDRLCGAKCPRHAWFA